MSEGVSITDIAWLAGFIEGEGSFCIGYPNSGRNTASRVNKYFYISLVSTDKDIIDKACKLLRGDSIYSSFRDIDTTNKRSYRFKVNGALAIGWMMTLYSFMGLRRRAKIKEVVTAWRNYKVINV